MFHVINQHKIYSCHYFVRRQTKDVDVCTRATIDAFKLSSTDPNYKPYD